MPEETPSSSAEKDLLKLIENPQEIETRKKASPVERPATTRPAPGGKARGKSAHKPFDLKAFLTDRKNIIKILFVIAVVVFVNLIVNIYVESRKLDRARNFNNFVVADKKIVIKEGEIAKIEEEQPEGGFRNIFRPKQKKVEEAKVDPSTQVLQNYKLVGISIDPDPSGSSAMIENVKTNVTFFLHKGETLDGMELVDILDEKLILRVQGQTVEMR